MKYSNIDNHIRKQVKKLMTELGIKKVWLGRALGGNKPEARQQYFTRAQRFLDGDGSIKVSVLVTLMEFFQKPLNYFLPSGALYPTTLNSSKTLAKSDNKELKTIEKNLRNLGFDEEFIKNQLRQLEAMEAYNARNDQD